MTRENVDHTFRVGDIVTMVNPGLEHIDVEMGVGKETEILEIGSDWVRLATGIPGRPSIIAYSFRIRLAPSIKLQGELF